MRLCLIRHGETEFNRAGRLQGGMPVSLTSAGLAAAARLGQLLRDRRIAPMRLICSPTHRARQTVAELALADPVEFDEAFRARAYGDIEGLTRAESDARYPGAMDAIATWEGRPSGASESQQQVAMRASARLFELLAEVATDDLVMVVTHNEVIVGLSRLWSGVYPPCPPPLAVPNTSANFFAWYSPTRAPVLVDVIVAK